MNQRLLHIVTICNDLRAYADMRQSLSQWGFDPASRYTLLDNSEGNRHDPYRVLENIGGGGEEPYVMLCHQDLIFNERTSLGSLMHSIEHLNEIDPRWAIAGTAGIDARGNRILHLDDPSGSYRSTGLPRKVLTLDENLLLFRRPHTVRTSAALSGFHFYGADVCLDAAVQKRTCYVIDFPLTHLSGGAATPAFFSAAEALARCWNPRLWIGAIETTCWTFSLSRSRAIRHLVARRSIRRWIKRLGWNVIARRSRTNPALAADRRGSAF